MKEKQEIPNAGAIGMHGCKDGTIFELPPGLTGTDVYAMVSLRRIGFGGGSGYRFIGAEAYLENAGVNQSNGSYQMRLRAYSLWETADGNKKTNGELAQVLLFRRSDFQGSISDSEDSNAIQR